MVFLNKNKLKKIILFKSKELNIITLRKYTIRNMSRSILKIKSLQSLKQCPKSWLPDDTIKLAEELETVIRHRVWFPVNEDGEPHEKNPDDGFGGATYKLTHVMDYEKIPVNKHHYKQNYTLYKNSLDLRIIGFSKVQVWHIYLKDWEKLDDPDYCLCGQMWRTLFGRSQRYEENQLEAVEREAVEEESENSEDEYLMFPSDEVLRDMNINLGLFA